MNVSTMMVAPMTEGLLMPTSLIAVECPFCERWHFRLVRAKCATLPDYPYYRIRAVTDATKEQVRRIRRELKNPGRAA